MPAKTARIQLSRIGANHNATRKPITTEGSEAMISTPGLMKRLNPGVANWLVYTAPKRASGTAKSIA